MQGGQHVSDSCAAAPAGALKTHRELVNDFAVVLAVEGQVASLPFCSSDASVIDI